MPKTVFRGDVPKVKQVWPVTPANVEVGDKFRCTVQGRADKFVEFTATAATVANVTAGLQTLLALSDIPEFKEVTFVDNTTSIGLTAKTAGKPFEFTFSTTNTTSLGGSVTIAETTPGVNPVNEVQKLELIGTYSGGTFTLTFDAQTTTAIAYNATASVVKAALEALSNIAVGDVVVTGGPGPNSPWFINWQGAYAEIEVNEITVNGASLTGNGGVSVETTALGSGASSEIQTLGVEANDPAEVTGTYTLEFNGEITDPIDTFATAATIQTDLENLSTIGSGNVSVIGGQISNNLSPGEPVFFEHFYWIIFQGALASQNVSLISADETGLALGEGAIMSIGAPLVSGGQSSTNEIQVVNLGQATAGIFTLSFDGQTTEPLAYNAQVNFTIRDALMALSNIDLVNIIGLDGIFSIEFLGSLTDSDVAEITVQTGLTGGVPPTVTTIANGAANTDEIQEITIFATGGTFTLSDGTDTTGNIAFDASAATVKTRLEADIAAITTVGVTGTGAIGDPFIVTYTNPGGTNVPELTGDGSLLTGGDGQAIEITAHDAGSDEVQTATVDASVTGGTLTLSFLGVETGPIDFDASAATVETAFEGLSTVPAGEGSVSGSAGGPWTFTFSGTLGKSNLAAIVADGTLLVGGSGTETLIATETTRSSGPNHFDAAGNWTAGRVPDSLDDLKWDTNTIHCLYGLLQVTTFTADAGTDVVTVSGPCHFVDDQILRVTTDDTLPAGLAINTSYYIIDFDRMTGTFKLSTSSGGAAVDITTAGTGTHTIGVEVESIEDSHRNSGKIGLHIFNAGGYREYRQPYLAIGVRPGGNKSVKIGTKEGKGSKRIKIDTGQYATEFKIIKTGSGANDLPAVMLLNTNPATNIVAKSGQIGIAAQAGEVSSVNNIIGEESAKYTIGDNVTVGGEIDVYGPFQSHGITMSSSSLIVR